MSDHPKAAWPKTDHGTIDWEVVFEDPDSGFIPLVEQINTPEGLKRSGEVIFEKLFTRKNDADARAQLLNRLHAIVDATDDIDAMRSGLIGLMRDVKDDRIKKARIYIERKNAGAAIDRRSGLFWKIDKLLSPWVLLPVGSVFVLALSAIIYVGLNTTLGGGERVAVSERKPVDGREQAQPQPPVEDDPIAEGTPFPIWLKTVRWPISPDDPAPPRYYAIIPFVTEKEHKIELCRRVPKVMDRIHVALEGNMPKDRPPRVDEMVEIRNTLKAELNAIMPDPWIVDIVVAPYGAEEFKVSVVPPFCKSPLVER